MNTDVIALTLGQLRSIPLVQAFSIVSTVLKVIESTIAAIITTNTNYDVKPKKEKRKKK